MSENGRFGEDGVILETKIGAERGLTPATTLLFAIACGLSVANVYVAQPLLDAMAGDFGVDAASIGIVVTVTQIGYALGLIFLVPLGDSIDRRRLILGQAALSAIALAIVASASDFAVLLTGMAAVGMLAVVVQSLVALTATLAHAAHRGRAVGTVTSGVVIGILLARFVSGVLADVGGWRLVYLSSAALTLSMTVLLAWSLPRHSRNEAPQSYAKLLWSIPFLFVREPLLRVRAVLALLIFMTFSIFWTAMVLPLSAAPMSLTHTEIGLFGLAGMAGAIAASGAGRLADRGLGERTTGLALALMLVAWLPIALMQWSIWPAIIGVVALDLAIQAVHVTNQSMIFARRPEARSRLVAGYMVFYSVGSATGAIASTTVYGHGGWSGVCMLGAGVSTLALVFWAATRRREECQAAVSSST
ncbi:putative MFS family arabinose efflux permease [Rhizobium sp. BK313]|uniref:MFS transporter n=1 Tax=Rhizobium sp. BK313 TaxID=2587081 RepID=UPI00105BBB78|nr:MFS transporter [Rhizobium sp. BK313]MBB3457898.1 putative MFS family arabinose efflux permease [Rhizobium sp. BK313]